MAVRIIHEIDVRASFDASGNRCIFSNSNDTGTKQVIDAFERAASGNLSITGGGVETLSLGDVGIPRGVYIRFYGDADIVLNGGADTLEVRRAADAGGSVAQGAAATFFFEGVLSSMQITNPDANAVLTAEYVVWGDPKTA